MVGASVPVRLGRESRGKYYRAGSMLKQNGLQDQAVDGWYKRLITSSICA